MPAWAARVGLAQPGLAPDSPSFRAAVVLLAAPSCRLNIDLLALRTGYPRAFVAGCARRLYDNGVWSGGSAAYASSSPEDPRFWNDVAVATGRLCRRTDARGRPEWAPPGTWAKPYDFVDAAPGSGLAIAYLDPHPPAGGDEAPAVLCASPAVEPLAAPRTGGELFPGAAWL
jgi:hypothetical protein